MITIDSLLEKIEDHGFEKLSRVIDRRDLRILKNLAHLAKKPDFITENQGRLTIKLLTENFKHLSFLGSDLSAALTDPKWSKKFRFINDPKKITIFSENDEKFLKIEAAMNSHLTKIFNKIEKGGTGALTGVNGKAHHIVLSEKNLYIAVKNLKSENFDISDEILGYYNEIDSWSKKDFDKKFILNGTDNEKVLKNLKDEFGPNTDVNDLLLADRKIRYQYQFSPENQENTLTSVIANRTSNKIFVNSTVHSLEELLNSLIDLKKLPILFVFNSFSEHDCVKQLDLLTENFKKLNLLENVGIYFRFKNQGHGEEFNRRIASSKFNKNLDTSTQIAGIANGKIAKFFLKTDWKPNSVISFTNSLRNNKTSVYCNNCDCVVYYTDTEPFIINI